jgi:hypothetical protein
VVYWELQLTIGKGPQAAFHRSSSDKAAPRKGESKSTRTALGRGISLTGNAQLKQYVPYISSQMACRSDLLTKAELKILTCPVLIIQVSWNEMGTALYRH